MGVTRGLQSPNQQEPDWNIRGLQRRGLQQQETAINGVSDMFDLVENCIERPEVGVGKLHHMYQENQANRKEK